MRVGLRIGQPGFGLGDVGAGDVADFEAVAGRLQLAIEHLDLVLVEFDDAAEADDIGIGGDDAEDDLVLDGAQPGAGGEDATFRRRDVRADAAALVERLAELEAGRIGAAVVGEGSRPA